MSRQFTQQRMTLSDLEWPFRASRSISAVAELLVRYRQKYRHAIVTKWQPSKLQNK